MEHTAAFGNGPVNALDNALRKALSSSILLLREMSLVDYKVGCFRRKDGTGSVIRVLIESSDGKRTWETLGVSENILEASWQALVDSIDYKLLLEEEKAMKRLLNIRDATKELNILRALDSYERPFSLIGTYRLIDDGTEA